MEEDMEELKEENKNNKKKKIVLWGSLTLVIVLFTVALLLIFLIPKEGEYYIGTESSLDVVLEGRGEYAEGEEVTIRAEEVEGYRFRNWILKGIEVSRELEYTFKASEETEGTYTANYDKLYSIYNNVQGEILLNTTQAIEGEYVDFILNFKDVDDDYVYFLNKVYYKLENNENEILIEGEENHYVFVMPSSNITIYTKQEKTERYKNYIANEKTILKYIGKEEIIVVPTEFSIYQTKSISNLTLNNFNELNEVSSILGGGYYATFNGLNGVEKIFVTNATNALKNLGFQDINDIPKSYYPIKIDFVKEFEINLSDVLDEENQLKGETLFSIIDRIYNGYNSDCKLVFPDNSNLIINGEQNLFELLEIIYNKFNNGNIFPISVKMSDTRPIIIKGENCNFINVGNSAFEGNSARKIYLPKTIKNILDDAFLSCEFEYINLEQTNLEKIGAEAFMECHNLNKIIIPSTVSYIDDSGPFLNCYNLTEITIESIGVYEQLIDWGSLGSLIYNATKIIVREDIVNKYNNTFLNNNFTKSLEEGYYIFIKK